MLAENALPIPPKESQGFRVTVAMRNYRKERNMLANTLEEDPRFISITNEPGIYTTNDAEGEPEYLSPADVHEFAVGEFTKRHEAYYKIYTRFGIYLNTLGIPQPERDHRYTNIERSSSTPELFDGVLDDESDVPEPLASLMRGAETRRRNRILVATDEFVREFPEKAAVYASVNGDLFRAILRKIAGELRSMYFDDYVKHNVPEHWKQKKADEWLGKKTHFMGMIVWAAEVFGGNYISRKSIEDRISIIHALASQRPEHLTTLPAKKKRKKE